MTLEKASGERKMNWNWLFNAWNVIHTGWANAYSLVSTRLQSMRSRNVTMKEAAVSTLGKAIFVFGIIIFGTIGAYLPDPVSGFWGFILGSLLWIALYVSIGFETVPQGYYLPIERFGIYIGFRKPGPIVLCFPGFIDREMDISFSRNGNGTMNDATKHLVPVVPQRIRLYKITDTNGRDVYKPGVEVDFSDGTSAAADVDMWVVLDTGDPECVRKFLFGSQNAYTLAESAGDLSVRSNLEGMSYEEARKDKTTVNQNLNADLLLISSLATVGLKLAQPKGIKLIDIDIPEDVKKIRLMEKEGEMSARKQAALAKGPQAGIRAIMEAEHRKSNMITWEEAKELYLLDKGLDTAKGSTLNLVGAGITDAITSLLKGK